MITYELALKLKEAGLPQKDCGEIEEYIPGTMEFIPRFQKPYIPTLSELIEACGDISFSLTAWMGEWTAKYSDQEDEEGGYPWMAEAKGSSPEEAVANLWLALNKK